MKIEQILAMWICAASCCLACPSSPIGLTEKELVEWLGNPIMKIPSDEGKVIYEYWGSNLSGEALSDSGLVGFGFEIVNGKVSSMLGRFRKEEDNVPDKAERITTELLKSESATEFVTKFDMNLVPSPLDREASLNLIVLVRNGIDLTAAEGEVTLPASSKILVFLKARDLLKISKIAGADLYDLGLVEEGLSEIMFRISEELIEEAKRKDGQVEEPARKGAGQN